MASLPLHQPPLFAYPHPISQIRIILLSLASPEWEDASSDSPPHTALLDLRVSPHGWRKTIISQPSLHHSPDPQGPCVCPISFFCFNELKSVLSAGFHNVPPPPTFGGIQWTKIEGRVKPEGSRGVLASTRLFLSVIQSQPSGYRRDCGVRKRFYCLLKTRSA